MSDAVIFLESLFDPSLHNEDKSVHTFRCIENKNILIETFMTYLPEIIIPE